MIILHPSKKLICGDWHSLAWTNGQGNVLDSWLTTVVTVTLKPTVWKMTESFLNDASRREDSFRRKNREERIRENLEKGNLCSLASCVELIALRALSPSQERVVSNIQCNPSSTWFFFSNLCLWTLLERLFSSMFQDCFQLFLQLAEKTAGDTRPSKRLSIVA